MEIKCPVCGQTTSGRFCTICGFELHLLPTHIGAGVESYERERVSKFKEKLKEIDDYVVKTKNLTEQLAARQKELEDAHIRMAKLEEALAQKEIVQGLPPAPKVEKPDSAPTLQPPLAYLVMMQGGSVFGIYGIQEGENTFGFAVSHGRHRQIICSARVADVHFAIKALLSKDQRGRNKVKFWVSPSGGELFSSAGGANIITKESPFEINDSVYIEDVQFTLVATQ